MLDSHRPVVAEVAIQVRIPAFHTVGNSFGGFVAYECQIVTRDVWLPNHPSLARRRLIPLAQIGRHPQNHEAILCILSTARRAGNSFPALLTPCGYTASQVSRYSNLPVNMDVRG